MSITSEQDLRRTDASRFMHPETAALLDRWLLLLKEQGEEALRGHTPGAGDEGILRWGTPSRWGERSLFVAVFRKPVGSLPAVVHGVAADVGDGGLVQLALDPGGRAVDQRAVGDDGVLVTSAPAPTMQ